MNAKNCEELLSKKDVDVLGTHMDVGALGLFHSGDQDVYKRQVCSRLLKPSMLLGMVKQSTRVVPRLPKRTAAYSKCSSSPRQQ